MEVGERKDDVGNFHALSVLLIDNVLTGFEGGL